MSIFERSRRQKREDLINILKFILRNISVPASIFIEITLNLTENIFIFNVMLNQPFLRS